MSLQVWLSVRTHRPVDLYASAVTFHIYFVITSVILLIEMPSRHASTTAQLELWSPVTQHSHHSWFGAEVFGGWTRGQSRHGRGIHATWLDGLSTTMEQIKKVEHLRVSNSVMHLSHWAGVLLPTLLYPEVSRQLSVRTASSISIKRQQQDDQL
jgi:hypothetical protein